MKKGVAAGCHTKAVHAGTKPNEVTGAIVDPIYQCSVYAQPSPGNFKYDYGRSMNPNYYPLEEALAALEFADYATVVSSGVGAISAVMTLVKAGDKIICPTDIYGGTYRLFIQILENYGLEFVQVDLSDLNAVEDELKNSKNAAMLYTESPTNPMLEVYDLEALSSLGKKYGVRTVTDNTFASPCCQNPLKLGYDIVLHSASKYLGGHSDIVGGAVMTNDQVVAEQMDLARKAIGLHLDPMSMFLLRRGLKTLPLRVERQSANAQKLAEHLEQHPRVERVIYPGLPGHAQHEIAKKQMSSFGGMISLTLNVPLEETKKAVSSFNVITLAESLGAVESLCQMPALMSNEKIPKEIRERHGLTEGVIRISVGIENIEDLIADIDQALG